MWLVLGAVTGGVVFVGAIGLLMVPICKMKYDEAQREREATRALRTQTQAAMLAKDQPPGRFAGAEMHVTISSGVGDHFPPGPGDGQLGGPGMSTVGYTTTDQAGYTSTVGMTSEMEQMSGARDGQRKPLETTLSDMWWDKHVFSTVRNSWSLGVCL